MAEGFERLIARDKSGRLEEVADGVAQFHAFCNVGLVFGGRSVEHEVSLASATSILKALDPTRYDVALLAVDREGRWHLGRPELPPEATARG